MLLCVLRRRQTVEEWALVLVAEGLSPRVERAPEGFALWVPQAEAERAVAVLQAYRAENRRPAPPSRSGSFAQLRNAALLGLALVLFFALTNAPRTSFPWLEHGRVDAVRVCGGEPWRTFTALTLHANLGHVLANAVVGSIFFAALFEALGLGVSAALVLASGAAGNWLNACLRGGAHFSIGASTAVFGALGLLAALGFARRKREERSSRAWLSLGGGLALLAMLGSGAHSDLGAHAFGFAAGVGLGLAAERLGLRAPPGHVWQWAAGMAAAAVLCGSWLLALA